MKKLMFLFTCVAIFGQLSAQNPFKELGIKDSDYLTLSDGRYDEFHEYNDYERVGSAIIDMRTNKIARFIDRDSVIGEGMAELDMTTRFLTIDPMAEKYFQMSPYAYCANNPIKNIDPTGMDWYTSTDGSATMWKKGSEEIEGYKNIGTSYTQTLNDGTSIKFDQSEQVEMTENVLDVNDFKSQMTTNSKGEVVKKEGEAGNCFFQSGEMVKASGVTSKAGEANNISDTPNGMTYMDSQIDQGKSVRVHVDRNGDATGDHWVAISSRTTDLRSQTTLSYGFYDPGTSRTASGTNIGNSLKLKSGSLLGKTFYSGKTYTVKAVRKNF